ncbi:CheY-like chemotaxis protein/PAS domain-containing protein [Azospirillum fermentarium]|uniref:response regulator n=1 Tax=Azospirillum fermentarium TaxID=1233114 RepID=UPI002226B35F|nr:response regulator [Azospirillum fermentarium]MCW2246616.1 CheY-like chemotaxis protein/PAS domain-containing protein [Azospirillum fermentarium]
MHILLNGAEGRINLCDGISHASLASWLFDLDRFCMVDANPAAVEFWEADSRDELLERDFATLSPAARARLLDMGERLRQGQVVYDLWTLYPRGRPKTIQCECRGEKLADGRIAMRVTAAAAPPQVDLGLEALRWTEAFRQTPLAISVYTQDGDCLIQNPAAILALGIKPPLLDHVRNRTAAQAALVALSDGETTRLTAEVMTQRGARHHDLYLRRTLDPATGRTVILVQELDVTEREDARRRLERSEALLSGVLAGSTDGMMAFCPVTGNDGTIRDFECRLANPAAGRLLGVDHATLPGRTASDLFGTDPVLLDRCLRVVQTGEPLETVTVGRLRLKAVRLDEGFTLNLSPLASLPSPQPRRPQGGSLSCGSGGPGENECVKRGASPVMALVGVLDRLAATGLTAEQAALLASARQMAAMAQEQDKENPVCSVCPQPCAPAAVPSAVAGGSRLDRLSSWAQHRGGRLLVVDDSPTNRMVTGAVLGKAGFTIELAASGEEAVRMVADAAEPPEAVLMDIAMPGMDGMAATAAIRSLPGGRGQMPIIAVTAHADPEDRDRCLQSGLDDYLSKPVPKVELLAALERWLTP